MTWQVPHRLLKIRVGTPKIPRKHPPIGHQILRTRWTHPGTRIQVGVDLVRYLVRYLIGYLVRLSPQEVRYHPMRS